MVTTHHYKDKAECQQRGRALDGAVWMVLDTTAVQQLHTSFCCVVHHSLASYIILLYF